MLNDLSNILLARDWSKHVTEYSPAKSREYPEIFLNFQNCAGCEKALKDNKHNSLHLGRKNCSLLGRVTSADKYPGILSCQITVIVYLLLTFELPHSSITMPLLNNVSHPLWKAGKLLRLLVECLWYL